MWKLRRFLKGYKKELLIGPFFKWLEAVFELIVPLVMASIIDNGINGDGGVPYIARKGVVLVLLGVAGLCFALICQYVASKTSQGVGTLIRRDLYAHINTLTHAELDQIGANSLTTRLINDVNQVQVAVAMLIRLVVRAPFLVLGATVMAMLLDLRLSVIFLIIAPLVAAVLYIVMSKSVPFYKIRQGKLDKVSLITRENLSGARVVRSLNQQAHETARFQQASDEVAEVAMRVGKLSAILNPAMFLILNIGIIAIVWFGGLRVNVGDLSQGQVIAFVNYMTQISLALVVVANLVVIFTKASASAARINEVFALQPSMQEGRAAMPAPEQEAAPAGTGASEDVTADACDTVPVLSFEDVSFAYPGAGEPSLVHINVSLSAGETLGVIGGTGSGKSTFVSLIPRFYDVTEGTVRVMGKPVQEYTYDALRGAIGMVPQKAVLFYGTIRDNMRWSKEDASDAEIARAIEIAQAKEFVDELPDGYDTVILQGSKNLSGGQKQRLTIARALVGSPRLLILDDSTSALDYTTDAALRRGLREKCAGTTVIMVSQRATSIQYADRILVLDDGGQVGLGTHEELLRTCEVYREICISQLGEEEVAAHA